MVASSVRHPITIGGKTYEVSPINDEGREALDEWVRAKFIERAAPMISKMSSDADKDRALRIAYSQAFSLTWLSGEGARLIATVDGVAKMLYEGIRPNHPDVSFEQIRAELFDPDNIRKATHVFDELNTNRVKRTEGGDESKKGKSRSRKKKST